jgi:two-component system CheB/CheR fusion protein
VQRLAHLLGHKIFVRSRLGKGSVFAIEIAGAAALPDASERDTPADPPAAAHAARRSCTILIVEDDPDIAELLVLFLTGEGHRVTLEKDGIDALANIEHAVLQPDLILSDYNLPRGMSGLQLATQVRTLLNREVPVIILTGDISSDTLRDVGQQNCMHLSKPVTLSALAEAIEGALPAATSVAPGGITPDGAPAETRIFIVDDDDYVRQTLLDALHEDGRTAEAYKDSETFLSAYQPGAIGCLLADAHLPGMSGLDLLRHLRVGGDQLPCVVITGNSDVAMAVQAMKEGANDFIEKPISYQALLAAIDNALEHASDSVKRAAWRDTAVNHIATLTPRQREIMDMVLAGQPSKNIAADLGISQRTVENHRASIMKRPGSQSLPALARLAVAAMQ